MSNKLNFKFDRDFTVVPNILLKDKRLSYKAKGIFLQIISVPENWQFSIAGLAAMAKESRSAITSGVEELIACGYLEWLKFNNARGQFCVEVNVFLPEPYQVLPDGEITAGENTTRQNVHNKELINKSILSDEKIVHISGVEWDKKSDVWEEAKNGDVRFKRV
jgi:hypothetical protein